MHRALDPAFIEHFQGFVGSIPGCGLTPLTQKHLSQRRGLIVNFEVRYDWHYWSFLTATVVVYV